MNRRDLVSGLAVFGVISGAGLAHAGSSSGASPSSWNDLLRGVLGGRAGAPLSNAEVSAGLKEALNLGAAAAIARVGRLDGYFKDPIVKIPLPGLAGKAQKQLKPLGLSGPLDDLQLRINRAAESAAPAAKDLFAAAIRSLTIDDAMGLLRGGDTAATQLLRAKTETGLKAAFRPPVDKALAESGAVQAFEGAIKKYNLSAFAGDPRASLADHAVSAGLVGLFHYLGEEEKAIRANPAKRTTALLRKVFGR